MTNSGDTGATTDRPVIGGQVVGRNTGRGTPIYDVEPFVGKRIALGTERLHANFRAEAFPRDAAANDPACLLTQRSYLREA